MGDDDQLAGTAKGIGRGIGIIGGRRVAPVDRQVDGEGAVAERLQLRHHTGPAPGAVPGAVDQSERRHR